MKPPSIVFFALFAQLALVHTARLRSPHVNAKGYLRSHSHKAELSFSQRQLRKKSRNKVQEEESCNVSTDITVYRLPPGTDPLECENSQLLYAYADSAASKRDQQTWNAVDRINCRPASYFAAISAGLPAHSFPLPCDSVGVIVQSVPGVWSLADQDRVPPSDAIATWGLKCPPDSANQPQAIVGFAHAKHASGWLISSLRCASLRGLHLDASSCEVYTKPTAGELQVCGSGKVLAAMTRYHDLCCDVVIDHESPADEVKPAPDPTASPTATAELNPIPTPSVTASAFTSPSPAPSLSTPSASAKPSDTSYIPTASPTSSVSASVIVQHPPTATPSTVPSAESSATPSLSAISTPSASASPQPSISTLPTPTPTPAPSLPTIRIIIDTLPAADVQLQGHIELGENTQLLPSEFKIVPYIFVSGWWNKPSWGQPYLPLDNSLSFEGTVYTHVNDAKYTDYLALFLFPVTSDVPLLSGDLNLPTEVHDIAVAEKIVRTCPGGLAFAGYDCWQVKSPSVRVAPGPNYFSSHPSAVFVDSNGKLHLTISKQQQPGIDETVWSSTEVFLCEKLGYGTYTWHLSGDLENLDPNAVLGLYTWDDHAPEVANREWDIEFTRWGRAQSTNTAQFVLQPYYEEGHLEHFNLQNASHTFDNSGKRVQHVTVVTMWWQGTLDFTVLDGHLSPQQLQDNTHTKTVIHHWRKTSSAVFDSGAECVNMNLWQVSGNNPARNEKVEIIIDSFTHTPNLLLR